MQKVLSNNCMVTDDGDKFTCVFYSWFSVKCHNPRGALSIPGRVGECAQGPGGSGHGRSHRVLGGRRSPGRELGWDTQTQGRSASAFQKTGRTARVCTGLQERAGGALPGRGAPRSGAGQLPQSPSCFTNSAGPAGQPASMLHPTSVLIFRWLLWRLQRKTRVSWSETLICGRAETAAPVSCVSGRGKCPPSAQLGAGP